MYKYEIEGNYPLKGKIKPSGNKNAALPCLAATLLSDEEIILSNLPEIEDVHVMMKILTALGSRVEKIAPHSYRLQTRNLKQDSLPLELSAQIRASILFAGPLLARIGKASFPPPGGDVIGRRRLDTHFLAFKELGVRVEVDGIFSLQANKLVGAEIFLDEASVTATENTIMAAAMAEGLTVIQNAASEPHVQDLCLMLNQMGAKITGIGSNILRIQGVSKLHGTEYKISRLR
jgi:UDP-N-acetylglucosamine 1-carboxyvinyltransferase